MTDKIFDDFFKNKLKGHSASVPDDMWNRILEKKEPVKPVGFFVPKTLLSVSGLIAICTLIGYLMLQTPSRVSENQDKNITAEIVLPNKNTNTSVSKTKPEIDVVKQKTQTVNDAEKENSGVEKFSENSSLLKDQVVGTESSIDALPSLKNQPTNSTTKIEKVANNTIAKMTGLAGKDEREIGVFSLTNFNRAQESILSFTAKEERHFNTNETNAKLLSQLNAYSISCLLDCPKTRRPGRNDWYVEVFASPDYAIKSISKNNSIDPNYFKRKDSTETMEGSFTAGVRVSKSIGENMLLKTGLQYSQINEQFKYRTENERRLTTVVTIRTIIRAPGDTVRISDTSMIEQIGYREKVTHNKYRSIDVPIILSYEWGEGWKKGINAGVLLNLHSWQQGEMLDTSYMPVAFNKANSQTFKTNIGVGVYVGFSLLKDIGNKTEIFAEPYFRYNISNMTTDKGLFNQKFNVAGLNLGIRYKLSGNRQRYTGR
jgi:hypothetical protein